MIVGIDVSQVVFGTGVSDYTQNLVANLKENDIKPFGFSFRKTSQIKKLIPNAKTFPIPLSTIEYFWNQRHVLSVEKFIGDMDIYHASDWTQGPTKARKITTIHDLTPFLFPEQTLPEICLVHKKKMSWAVKECDAFICVSTQTAYDLHSIFDVSNKKIFIIPEALPSRFLLKPNSSPYSNYIVAMGSRQPRKNIARLVSSFLNYRQELKLPQKLVIIGENNNKSFNPDIIYTGYIPDQVVVDIISGAEAFVYPSLYEGFGLPVLVGFSCSVPVVCSNSSSLPELSGNAAVLVDALSEKSISQGISQALKNRNEYVKLGHVQLANFSWEKTAKLTSDVYNSLV